jgi:hypothetical protein
MTPEKFLTTILSPGLGVVANVCALPVSKPASILLLAVALQESGLESRFQKLNSEKPGPARGWWQFESDGGVKGVMTHPASKDKAEALCAALDVEWDRKAIWRALEGHDILAVGFARLLLWTDPKPIPTNEVGAWELYANRLWRPGKPHPKTWPACWKLASA